VPEIHVGDQVVIRFPLIGQVDAVVIGVCDALSIWLRAGTDEHRNKEEGN
jgi:hypothetical protein